MKNYLGRDSGLAAVIRAVIDGSLVPVGYTNRFRGITGYLFRSDDLRKYRPVPGMTVHPEGVVTLRGGGNRFGRIDACDSPSGQIGHSAHHGGVSERFSKLLPAVDVQRFAEGYVATSVLAKRFHLDSGSLGRYLKESGTQLLGIPLPDPGNYYAFFLRKDVAAQIRLPSRRMLREEARRRIKAARKKKWAEYRQARETALGKPMRRHPGECRAVLLVAFPSIRLHPQ